MRGATTRFVDEAEENGISIHAPRERSDASGLLDKVQGSFISIHAPRERSDRRLYADGAGTQISIHAPRERSDF